ncbi:LysR substrate-binding domain-containing protein [Roseomonas sp. USHLN139]|uniref:LysR substrate-binding domain-containing protein n=1 Tax=Roseomonas sp. USHLN139 TaxID=3081298 RepID=UPI003B020DED
MNLAGLNIRDLDYAVAVAEFLHFGRAAQSRNVSQPTLSAQLRKLEEMLGVTLFERGARGVLVTAAGEALVAQARVILAEARRLGELAQAAAEPLSGSFRLGVIATLGPYLLPLLLGPMRARYPKLQLVLTEGMTRPLIHALEAGELDAVIASTPVEDPGLTALPLFREALVLAVPRDHPLAAVERVELADLPVEELILLSEGHCLRDQALACCPQARRGPRGVEAGLQAGRQAASLETLRQMIGHGMGCSLLPQLAVQVGSLLDDMVAYRLVHGSSPERQLALVHRPSFGRIRDIRLLRELLLDALASAGTLTVHARPGTKRDALPRD